MSAPEGLAALPGGDRLASLASKIDGAPSEIRAIARRWRATAKAVGESGGRLGRAVTIVDRAWRGASADAFDDHMRKYGRAAGELRAALLDCASKLDGVATVLGKAETNVNAICNRLLNSVATYRNKNPHVPESDLRPGIVKLVNAAIEKVKSQVGAADKAVTAAKTDIKKRLDERQITFSDIQKPGDGAFEDADGWVRTPGFTLADVPGGAPTTVSMAAADHNAGAAGGDGGGPGAGNGGAGGTGSGGAPPPGGGPAPTGQVKAWIDEAIEILRNRGYPVEKMNPSDIAMIIKHESGGNPSAVNNWDSNAVAGTPSKGLMQTIDPTFNAHNLPGHGDIYDPVDNIIAGVRYAIERYGSVSNVPGVVGVKNGTGYVGY